MTTDVAVICMKWGKLNGPHYVNRLQAMTARHLSRPHRFVCLTDDATGLAPGVEALPIPPLRVDPPYQNTPWRKLALYAREIGDLRGTALFLDLDVVIVGALDPLVEGPAGLRSIRNWTTPRERTANTSVIRFEFGAHADMLERFHAQPTQHWVDRYRIEQRFLSRELPQIDFFPEPWCVSFKENLLPGRARFPRILFNRVLQARAPGPDARMAVFHGHPDPDQAMDGSWPGAWCTGLRPARWIGEHLRE